MVSNVSSPQSCGASFDYSVTARDVLNNIVADYNKTLNVSNSTNSIMPAAITLVNGAWSGKVLITRPCVSDFITVSEVSKQCSSNTFSVTGQDIAQNDDNWVMGFRDAAHTGTSTGIVNTPLNLAWTWHDTNEVDNNNNGSSYDGDDPEYWLPLYYNNKIFLQGGLNSNRIWVLSSYGRELWHAKLQFSEGILTRVASSLEREIVYERF